MLKKVLVRIYLMTLHLLQYVSGVFVILTDKREGNRAILIGTPEHDNIGDHAIALAEERFIKRFFSEYKIYEIPVDRWRKYAAFIRTRIKINDLVFITGGGNMGNVYLEDEKLKRFAIKRLSQNLITVFPQTVYYEDTPAGRNELLKTKRIFDRHHNLILVAREMKSFELMRVCFPNNIHIPCPDMVFYLDFDSSETEKNNIIGICFRNDTEAIVKQDEKKKIIKALCDKHTVRLFSTLNATSIDAESRQDIVMKKLSEVASYGLVITDRLHGMIFSVIVGTACKILPSVTQKITSTMLWPELKGLVAVYDEKFLDNALAPQQRKWDRSKMEHYFETLASTINYRLGRYNNK